MPKKSSTTHHCPKANGNCAGLTRFDNTTLKLVYISRTHQVSFKYEILLYHLRERTDCKHWDKWALNGPCPAYDDLCAKDQQKVDKLSQKTE